MNLRPSGYEPDELPGCSTPRQVRDHAGCAGKQRSSYHGTKITKLVKNTCGWKTRRRPTLPCLKTKYHRRYRLSRPSSEWDRVGHLRHNHLVIQVHETHAGLHHRQGSLRHPKILNSGCLQDRFVRGIRLCARLIKPIERLVPVSFTHYCASTPGLSTWWSSTVLKRILVSRGASRLDAFSGYPFRT